MDYGALISESIQYTREALTVRWSTLLVFIICSLPMALIQFTFDPNTIVDKTSDTIHWELIPWTAIIALVAAGVLLSFFVSGYLVRVYRGGATPPVFDRWGSLYLDGIKVLIVGILWYGPALVLGCAGLGLIFFSLTQGADSAGLILAGILLLLISCIPLLAACIFAFFGTIRFARTGSIREGIRLSAVLESIRTIGWVPYIIALLILFAAGSAYSAVVSVFSFIPFVGWLFVLALNPFFSVFSARYMSRVYDHGAPQAPAAVPGTPP